MTLSDVEFLNEVFSEILSLQMGPCTSLKYYVTHFLCSPLT